MSLKTFHIIFVSVAILLTVGFGIWGVRDYQATDNRTSLYMGLGSFLVTLVLAVYGVWFLKKLKGVSYI
jgi:hypothetical protein